MGSCRRRERRACAPGPREEIGAQGSGEVAWNWGWQWDRTKPGVVTRLHGTGDSDRVARSWKDARELETVRG